MPEGAPASDHKQLQTRCNALIAATGDADRAELRQLLLRLSAQIAIGLQNIQLSISRAALARELDLPPDGGDPDLRLTCERPLTLRKRGVETRLVLGDTVSTHPDPTLIKMIGNAHGWMERLRSGEVTSIRSLAREEGLDHRHVTRALPFAFLAPDIVEAVLEGRQPASLTASGLKRLTSLPIHWADQRSALGFV